MEIQYEQPKRANVPPLEYIKDLKDLFHKGIQTLAHTQIIESDVIDDIYLKAFGRVSRDYSPLHYGKSDISRAYVTYVNEGLIEPDLIFDTVTTKKSSRSNSGILEVTTALEGLKNSCKYDCHMCPNEREEYGAKNDLARSYLSTEGVFRTGLIEDFDVFRLVIRRLIELEYLGHVVDKIEWIILGGTFHSYPEEYLDSYMSGGWRAFNLYKFFSSRFYGEYASAVRQWISEGGLRYRKSLREMKEWPAIMYDLQDFYPTELPLSRFHTDNEKVTCARCVGLSIETRPDQISRANLTKLREYGCTRIQLGFQHQNPDVLSIINRAHTPAASKRGAKMVLDAGFKLDGHFMMDLPGSTIEKDLEYLREVFTGTDLQTDYCKIYYCLNLPFTQIRKWYNRALLLAETDPIKLQHIHSLMTTGTYRDLQAYARESQQEVKDVLVWLPYAESDPDGFREASQEIMTMIPPWTRCVRVQRDFCQAPTTSGPLPETTQNIADLGYVSKTIKSNEQQLIMNILQKQNRPVREIRSREIKKTIVRNALEGSNLVVTQYQNAKGTEYYMSLEYPKTNDPDDPYDSYILGQVRLRIKSKAGFRSGRRSLLKDLQCENTGLVRELHVYGAVKGVTKIKASSFAGAQHRGIGTFLMSCAENVTRSCGLRRLAVISGIGSRDYYRKLGYELSEHRQYMIKPIEPMDPRDTRECGYLVTNLQNRIDVSIPLVLPFSGFPKASSKASMVVLGALLVLLVAFALMLWLLL